jgi:RNA polymerase sigma-70 factor (ECF subfamily)
MMDEKEAIQTLKRGDIRGLEVLVTCYQVKAIRTAYLITHDHHLAQDVVQDVFLQIYHGIGRFDLSRPFEPWFMRSVVHAAIKAAQKAAGQLPMEPDNDESWLEDWLAMDDSVEARVESSEFQEKIWEAMQNLSSRQRAVIVQRYFLEMSEREMADELRTAPGTVKWLLNAARARLRNLLGSERSAQ